MAVKTGSRPARMCASKINVRFVLTLLIGLALMPGCAHRYLLKLTNGDQMISISKPTARDGNYHYRDQDGVECVIPRNRVASIETGAVESKEKKSDTPAGPKKSRHWYLLWLG
jgi:hypothetical protein